MTSIITVIFKTHKLKWQHFSITTKQSRVQKRNRLGQSERWHAINPALGSAQIKRVSREFIPVQHPFYRMLHLELEEICYYHKHHPSLTMNFLIASVCCIVGWGKEVKIMSVKKPNATPIRLQPTFANRDRTFEIQASSYTTKWGKKEQTNEETTTSVFFQIYFFF